MCRMLKVGMVVNFLPDENHHGGVAYQVHTLANKLSKEFDITIFAINQTDLIHNYKNIKVKLPGFLTKNRFLEIIFFPLFVRFQTFKQFDIFHTHGDDFLFFFLRKPIIRTFYGSALGEFRTASANKRKLHQFFRYFAEYLSGFYAKMNVGISFSTKKYLPFINEIIPCGIDLEKFKPSNKKSEHPSILFVGTIEGRKRGWFLAKVFKNWIKPKIPDAELWVVSSEKVEGEDIKWFGHIPEEKLIELYQKAWVFCLPSLYEGFGVPYIEAMACGTAVVTTPNSGAMEVLKNGKYGIIVNDKLLGTSITWILKNKNLRAKYVKEGLKRVQEFSWNNIGGRYLKLYNFLLMRKIDFSKILGHQNNDRKR